MTPALHIRVAVWLLRAYQIVLSPWLGPACRFEPSCSSYAIEAVRRHGVVRGGWLGIRRLSRCHPLGDHGYDPVPGGECHGS
jgi:putative membrane protein insertion efficiency factor